MTSRLPTLREVCACGHDKSTHCPEVYSTGDVEQERRTYWGACLATFCECMEYLVEKDQS